MSLLSAADIFNRHALDYQNRFMDVSAYAASLEQLCSLLPAQAELLELGCGPGNVTRYLLDRRPDLHITATDIAPNMLELGRANTPQADFLLLDCRDLARLRQGYRAIVCGFVFPYLSPEETETLIAESGRLLESQGLLYLSFMEATEEQRSGTKTNSFGEQLYLHYHDRRLVEACLQRHGYELLERYPVRTPGPNGGYASDLILLARKTGIEFE